MKSLINIFWNSNEQRLRGFLRIGIQLLFLLIISFILGAIFLAVQSFLNSISSGAALSRLLNNSLFVMNALLTFIAIFAAVWLAGKWLDHRKWADFGLHINSSWLKQFAAGLALGAVLMAAIFLVELAMGWITVTGVFEGSSQPGSILKPMIKTLLIYLSVGFYEELYFRGYLLRNLAESFNFSRIGARASLAIAWLLSSVVFGLAHFTNPNATIISTLNIFLAGLFLGLGYILTGELAISMGLHITWNLFQGYVFGFPVSGTSMTLSIFQISQSGPSFMTGGAFGPEAGLIGIFAIVVGSVLIFYLPTLFGHGQTLQDALARYQANRQKSYSETGAVK